MKRTPEYACIEYAIAVAEVRRLSTVIRENKCPAERAYEPETGYSAPSCVYERMYSNLPVEGMCENCQRAQKAFDERKAMRKRLNAAKRSVESIGKRLRAA